MLFPRGGTARCGRRHNAGGQKGDTKWHLSATGLFPEHFQNFLVLRRTEQCCVLVSGAFLLLEKPTLLLPEQRLLESCSGTGSVLSPLP